MVENRFVVQGNYVGELANDLARRTRAKVEERRARKIHCCGCRSDFPPQSDSEATIELVYRYQVARWCSIQPHAQYVVWPGGTTEPDNTLILGLRTNVAF